MQATLIHESGGTHLVLSSTKTGAANAIQVDCRPAATAGLNQLVYQTAGTQNLTQKQPAQDAHIKVAGFDHYSATNEISGAIDGVTLTVKSTTEVGSPVALNVTFDNAQVQKNVQTFVDAFNALQKQFVSLRSYNSDTRTTGPLFGDATLRQVEDMVRSDLSNTVSGLTGNYTSLASIGITRQIDGTMALNADKLNTAIASGNGAVAQIFGSANGVAARTRRAHHFATRERRDIRLPQPVAAERSQASRRRQGRAERAHGRGQSALHQAVLGTRCHAQHDAADLDQLNAALANLPKPAA